MRLVSGESLQELGSKGFVWALPTIGVNSSLVVILLSLVGPIHLGLALALLPLLLYPALLLGVWMGWWVVDGWDPVAATGSTVSSIVAVFQDAGNARILIYSLMVGSVLTLISATGGVEGFVAWIGKRRWVTNRRQAQMVPFLLGVLITVLGVGIAALPAGIIASVLPPSWRGAGKATRWLRKEF